LEVAVAARRHFLVLESHQKKRVPISEALSCRRWLQSYREQPRAGTRETIKESRNTEKIREKLGQWKMGDCGKLKS
jgi:hypothetical protein